MRWWWGLLCARSWIFIVLSHCNNSPRVDMSLYSDTLFWFRANQSLFLLLNAACLAVKQQIPILMSLVWPDRARGEHSNHYATNAVSMTMYITNTYRILKICAFYFRPSAILKARDKMRIIVSIIMICGAAVVCYCGVLWGKYDKKRGRTISIIAEEYKQSQIEKYHPKEKWSIKYCFKIILQRTAFKAVIVNIYTFV